MAFARRLTTFSIPSTFSFAAFISGVRKLLSVIVWIALSWVTTELSSDKGVLANLVILAENSVVIDAKSDHQVCCVKPNKYDENSRKIERKENERKM